MTRRLKNFVAGALASVALLSASANLEAKTYVETYGDYVAIVDIHNLPASGLEDGLGQKLNSAVIRANNAIADCHWPRYQAAMKEIAEIRHRANGLHQHYLREKARVDANIKKMIAQWEQMEADGANHYLLLAMHRRIRAQQDQLPLVRKEIARWSRFAKNVSDIENSLLQAWNDDCVKGAPGIHPPEQDTEPSYGRTRERPRTTQDRSETTTAPVSDSEIEIEIENGTEAAPRPRETEARDTEARETERSRKRSKR